MKEGIVRPSASRMAILINIALLTFMATLDGSIVNVALPTMAVSLSTDTGTIAWVVTSYLLAIAASILLFGKIADSIGMTKVFLGGVGLFAFGSLLCGVSPSFPVLVAARIIQGLGASAAMATNQGLVAMLFPPGERGKALGILGSFVALGTLSGPPLGGLITDFLSWHYVFLINVPIGAAVLYFGIRSIPDFPGTAKAKPDFVGAALFAASMVALFASFIRGGEKGFGDPAVLAGLVAFAALFPLFVFRERRAQTPLIDTALFRNGLFTLSLACGFLSFVAISASTIVLPFYLQNARHLSPSAAGLLMMAYPLVLAVVAPLSGRLSDRIGSESLTFAGLLTVAAGLALMATLDGASPMPRVLAYVAVMALGNGMFQSPNTSLIMSSVPRAALGVAGSLNAFIRNFGMVFGISAAVSLLYGLMGAYLGTPVFSYVPGRDDAFFHGMGGTYLAAAAACAVGAAFTLVRLVGAGRPPKASPEPAPVPAADSEGAAKD